MHPRALSILDFTYPLPEDRIAQEPLADRDASRLLVARHGVLTDLHFRDLPAQLPADALLVLNDTRVVNARLEFRRSTGARIEVLCLEPWRGRPVEQAFAERGSSDWNAFVGNAKRWKEGEELQLEAGDGQVVLRVNRVGAEHVRFNWEPAELTFAEVLEKVGHVPLPPYMKRPDTAADQLRYNTVFAQHQGSVAAPTASLHFSNAVLAALKAKGIASTALTLHVGAGTFLPVKSSTMDEHVMHREQVRVPLAVLETLADRSGKGPVVPVGTTALRTLESIYWHGVMLLEERAAVEMDIDQWEPYRERTHALPDEQAALKAVIQHLRTTGAERLTGSTRLLIAPGYKFHFADALVTNFHQPQSTLLLLVAAFLGPDWKRVYQHAVNNNYRFLSYGDGSLLWRS